MNASVRMSEGGETVDDGTESPACTPALRVALLTAGRDRPYALGLATVLLDQGIALEFVGGDEVDGRELGPSPLLRVLHLRGDQTPSASLLRKIRRIVVYYGRLVAFAARTEAPLLHILWNNRFEWLDRTVLMGYYLVLRKKIVLTAHNVNAGERDGTDSLLNRLTLRAQYRLADHVFVHTEKMRRALAENYGVADTKVSVIPFGINGTVPRTALTSAEAKRRLGLDPGQRAMLFFGNIAPYKGLEYLVAALARMCSTRSDYRLVIAGRPKGNEAYWQNISREIATLGIERYVVQRIAFVPDAEVEVYFKGADVLVLPYVHIFQSGVLFLGYNFGLPVVATDVGSLTEEIVEGRTGYVCRPRDPVDLAGKLCAYFASDLYEDLPRRRRDIESYAVERYSWSGIGQSTAAVYRRLVGHG